MMKSTPFVISLLLLSIGCWFSRCPFDPASPDFVNPFFIVDTAKTLWDVDTTGSRNVTIGFDIIIFRYINAPSFEVSPQGARITEKTFVTYYITLEGNTEDYTTL